MPISRAGLCFFKASANQGSRASSDSDRAKLCQKSRAPIHSFSSAFSELAVGRTV